MTPGEAAAKAGEIADKAKALALEAEKLAAGAKTLSVQTTQATGGLDPLVMGLTVFALACFVGYYVVWSVTPALHTPLMSVTNAISSVIVVGALVAVGADLDAGATWATRIFGFLGVCLASVNIFGGFLVTERMLAMYKKKA